MGTGISITNISAPDSVMSFDLAFERNRVGFPKIMNGRLIVGATLAADFDGDGVLELFVPTKRTQNPDELYVFEPDGTDYLDGDATPTPFAASRRPSREASWLSWATLGLGAVTQNVVMSGAQEKHRTRPHLPAAPPKEKSIILNAEYIER